jgi:hypothetical protein
MSTGQTAVPHGRHRLPAVTAIFMSALALAVGTGIGVSTVEARSQVPAAAPPVVLVTPLSDTGGTMSDAAYQAFHAPALTAAAVSDTGGTMSDAAYQAFHAPALTGAGTGARP